MIRRALIASWAVGQAASLLLLILLGVSPAYAVALCALSTVSFAAGVFVGGQSCSE